jgi:photosystem II stability/assembly factor-like uncharacterized protein
LAIIDPGIPKLTKYSRKEKKMKKVVLQIAFLLFTTTLIAQWVPVNNGLGGFPPTALWPSENTMILGTYGGGVYITYDHGDNWTEHNGDLPNLFVNDLRTHIGMVVATDGGPFATYDGITYYDCTGTGLTNTDINFFTFGNEGITGDLMVGTNGGGLFAGDHTSPWIMNWTAASTGLSGDGLIVNDGVGVHNGWALIATEGGTYRALEGATEWTQVNNGLSGDALKVKRISGFGASTLFIATHSGLFYSTDLGDNWIPAIPDVKLNTVFVHMSEIYPSEMVIYTFGENGFYTDDFVTWTEIGFEGIEGEVTAAHVDSLHLYLGFTVTSKDSKDNGGVYRKPIQQVVSVEEILPAAKGVVLYQNFPNPFSENTNISYTISDPGFVSLKLFNIVGEEIHTIVNEFKASGTYTVPLDANSFSEGVYFYSIKTGNDIRETRRMIIVR